MRRKYGRRIAKIPLDAGFTCPNIDGTCGVGGCIYCSGRGSGDTILESPSLSLQYESCRRALSSKWDTSSTIAYLQAHTNTYAPTEKLREVYGEIIGFDGVVGISVATRADCLSDEVCELLGEVSRTTDLTVELGLQSSNDETARRINRGHDFDTFKAGYRRLRGVSDRITICIHMILGLPGESHEEMLQTVRDISELHPDQVKIHLLHVLKNTKMENMLRKGEYVPLAKEEYVSLVCDTLELLPPDTVISRLTGDGLASELLAPEWSKRKVSVINDIDKELFLRNSYQGKKYRNNKSD